MYVYYLLNLQTYFYMITGKTELETTRAADLYQLKGVKLAHSR
jgi:hypothetical protein